MKRNVVGENDGGAARMRATLPRNDKILAVPTRPAWTLGDERSVDSLAPARGTLLALLLSALFWIPLGLALLLPR